MKKKNEKAENKTDIKCMSYVHNHCLKTINKEYGTRMVQLCNLDAEYCEKKKSAEVGRVEK